MNIDKYKQVAFLNSTKNTDTALVFASYQPNKVSSELLRIALKSLEKINLETENVKVDIDLKSEEFDDIHNKVVQKRGLFVIPKKSFNVTISGITFIFRKV